jgi:glycosyltransferase involved in cell wall biosynthesis
MADLSKVSIGIKTFLRDSHLRDAIAGIEKNFSACEIVIADDGRFDQDKDEMYRELRSEGHLVEDLPFDSGFGFKSNWIAQHFRRDYLLVASDDFDFHPPEVVRGIEKLVDVLDHTDVDIASGRVNNWPYEFDLEDFGDTIIEHQIRMHGGSEKLWFIGCSLTVNYSLMKRFVFSQVMWDNDVKIGGGEHGAFFVDAQRGSLKTAYVPGVNINTQKKLDPLEYRPYRLRALCSERPCFVKRGIKKYVLGDGRIDYEEKS